MIFIRFGLGSLFIVYYLPWFVIGLRLSANQITGWS